MPEKTDRGERPLIRPVNGDEEPLVRPVGGEEEEAARQRKSNGPGRKKLPGRGRSRRRPAARKSGAS